MNGKPKILSVDDSPANLMAVRKLLSRFDVDVIEARSGNEALAATLDNEFALILLDVSMPDMSGFEVANLLAQEPSTRETPIIFVSATYSDEVHRLQGYHSGAVDYITKPLDERILRSKVQVFLDLYRRGTMLRRALSQLAERNAQLEREIAERRQTEAEVRHLASHDHLTGLPNRRHFMDVLERAVARSTAESASCALLYFDVDGFKPINDQHGHVVGDEVLLRIAERLRGFFGDGSTVARLGGDEFAIVIEDIADAAAATAQAERVASCLKTPLAVVSADHQRSLTLEVRVSIGIAVCPQHGRDADGLIRAADQAMYVAKRARSGRSVIAPPPTPVE
ncbi:diguanylate cyclase domain-containing protein [Dokdonella koreensis]|uniref:Diguanylate cyclase n=1 Tax=Dokdonella koreensis DS-123 TaxID=1300342 RepID=A0A160DVF6_9GAMM|nr:diguanylate cyclase [Dokdonella koreensis]ANB18527.1 Diguanylate cyclase [Dokdonella koreensis DS-123]